MITYHIICLQCLYKWIQLQQEEMTKAGESNVELIIDHYVQHILPLVRYKFKPLFLTWSKKFIFFHPNQVCNDDVFSVSSTFAQSSVSHTHRSSAQEGANRYLHHHPLQLRYHSMVTIVSHPKSWSRGRKTYTNAIHIHLLTFLT